MLILRNIIITLLLLTLMAIAVVGLMVELPPVLSWHPDRVNAIGRSVVQILRPGLLLFIIWVVVFLATLLVFFMTVARPRRRMKIEVQMGGGRVVIMDAAIKRYVRNALAELNEVTVKKIDLREHRGQVTTDIYADVRTRENLPTLERRIISRVRAALAEDLGITNLGDVHVYIKNFEVTGRPIKPAPEPAEQPEVARTMGPDETLHAAGAAATGTAAAVATDIEPVIGGETVSDAETHTEESPLVFPAGESAAMPPDAAGEQTGTLTAVPETEEVILAEKLLPAQEDSQGEESPAPAADHEDLDEPLPWDLVRPDRNEGPDEDKENGGLRNT